MYVVSKTCRKHGLTAGNSSSLSYNLPAPSSSSKFSLSLRCKGCTVDRSVGVVSYFSEGFSYQSASHNPGGLSTPVKAIRTPPQARLPTQLSLICGKLRLKPSITAPYHLLTFCIWPVMDLCSKLCLPKKKIL